MSKCVICGEPILDGMYVDDDGWCLLCLSLVSRGLPEHYLKAKKSDIKGVRAKLFEGHESLFIHGKVGTGKTWLASALMREQLRNSIKAIGNDSIYADDFEFVSMPEFAISIRASMNRSSDDSESKIVSRYSKVKSLFFDDIGAEKPSDYIKSILFVLIERRNTKIRGRTVITSNLDLNELSKLHGVRIGSRISEMCRVIEITGPDRRKR